MGWRVDIVLKIKKLITSNNSLRIMVGEKLNDLNDFIGEGILFGQNETNIKPVDADYTMADEDHTIMVIAPRVNITIPDPTQFNKRVIRLVYKKQGGIVGDIIEFGETIPTTNLGKNFNVVILLQSNGTHWVQINNKTVDTEGFLKYTAQSLTDLQQEQVQKNIGKLQIGDVPETLTSPATFWEIDLSNPFGYDSTGTETNIEVFHIKPGAINGGNHIIKSKTVNRPIVVGAVEQESLSESSQVFGSTDFYTILVWKEDNQVNFLMRRRD